MPDDGWSEYLYRYHELHPGITEQVLNGSPHPDVGTAYQWLRSTIPQKPGRVVDLACGSAPMPHCSRARIRTSVSVCPTPNWPWRRSVGVARSSVQMPEAFP